MYDLSNGSVSSDLELPLTYRFQGHGVIFMPIDVLSVLCAQLTRDLLAIANFLLLLVTAASDLLVHKILLNSVLLSPIVSGGVRPTPPPDKQHLAHNPRLLLPLNIVGQTRRVGLFLLITDTNQYS